MEILSDNFVSLITMAVLLLISAMFSGAETAMFSLSKYKLAKLEEEKCSSAKIIISLLKNPSNLLGSILLGNMTVNIFFFCISTIINFHIGKDYGTWYLIPFWIVTLLSLIIFGDIIPKVYGIKYPVSLSKLTCYPIATWQYISRPVRALVNIIVNKLGPKHKKKSHINTNELKMLLRLSQKDGHINEYTSEMIEDIIKLSSLQVKHIMIPRSDCIQCSNNDTIDDAIKLAKFHNLFLLPVYEGKKDELIGFVDIKKICFAENLQDKIQNYIIPAKFIPETKNVGSLLIEMFKGEPKMLFIVDEYGDITGTITIDKILKEVVGEIEHTKAESNVPLVEKLSENTYRLQANLSFTEWQNLFGNTLETTELFNVHSIGGFITYLLGKIPKEGESVTFKNLTFTVESVVKNRIRTIILKLNW